MTAVTPSSNLSLPSSLSCCCADELEAGQKVALGRQFEVATRPVGKVLVRGPRPLPMDVIGDSLELCSTLVDHLVVEAVAWVSGTDALTLGRRNL